MQIFFNLIFSLTRVPVIYLSHNNNNNNNIFFILFYFIVTE